VRRAQGGIRPSEAIPSWFQIGYSQTLFSGKDPCSSGAFSPASLSIRDRFFFFFGAFPSFMFPEIGMMEDEC
jgi:hypothetical protein